MSTLAWILVATALGGVLSALVAALFLLLSGNHRARVLPHLISFATGTLLGAALLKLLPHAISGAGLDNAFLVGLSLVGGIFAFFVLEKFVLWRHCHVEDCDTHSPQPHSHSKPHAGLRSHADALAHVDAQARVPSSPPDTRDPRDRASGTLILTGDAIHNALDGVLIAAAFLHSVPLGIATSIAVFAHEIPQEVGDFAILLHSGMSRARAFALNLLTSLTSVVGGVIAYFALAQATQVLPYALSVAAASFLYVAVADLIPGLHKRVEPVQSLQQIALIALGIGLIVLTDLH